MKLAVGKVEENELGYGGIAKLRRCNLCDMKQVKCTCHSSRVAHFDSYL